MSMSRSFISGSISADSGFDDLQNPKYSYNGNVDENGFREKYGCQTWSAIHKHKYAGYFLYNNMHEKGFYFIQQEQGCSFFDGQLYNNKLEGYGQIIYNDGSVYEGLFKNNRRFGPGVVTYSDEAQDVGLWNGNSLLRLSISVSSNTVPSICSSNSSRVKILRFRKIIPTSSGKHDAAKNLMQNLEADKEIFSKYPELYNPHVRNEHSLFFDRRFYDLAQLGSEDTIIEVLEDESVMEFQSAETEAEDDICPCVNERCVHLTKQLDEIDQELKNIRDLKMKYEKQIEKCIKCCKNHVGTIESKPEVPEALEPEERSETDDMPISENLKHNSRASFSQSSSRNGVIKDLSRMKSSSSIINITEISEVADKSNAQEHSVNKIFMNEAEFLSEESADSIKHEESIEGLSEKYTCACMDEEVPEFDFLMTELGKLRKNENFFLAVVDLLNRVLYKETKSNKNWRTIKTVKMNVDDLLTWNNEKIAIEILQHCFRYRKFEGSLSFSVKSLLIGDRTTFGKIGKMEKISIEYLMHCAKNQLDEVRKDLLKHNINPDLCDAKGNTGLHFAVSKDCHEIIRQLANLGANLDAFNDECLTPLILSILKYIAEINKVVSWEKAFLADIILSSKDLDQVTQWRPHESLVSLGDFMISSAHLRHSGLYISTSDLKKSSEEMSAKIRSHIQSLRTNSIAPKVNLNFLLSTSYVEDYDRYKKFVISKKYDDRDEKRCETIKQTISTLLYYGADSNKGEVPMSPILLAIFSRNTSIVEDLLTHHADPNTATEDNLSALHILASLPFSLENIQISEVFLKYSCEPNTKTKPDFWIEQNDELIGNYVSVLGDNAECEGKSPLQMIFMRKDFDEENVVYQCAQARLLIEYGALYNQYYLGHTLLSLAVLKGNTKLITTVFPYVDRNQPLGESMGNALTVLGLTRFPYVKAFSKCREIIDTLISLGLNPFNSVYDFPNIFEFFSYDSSEDIDYHIPKVRAILETEFSNFRRAVYSEGSNNSEYCNKMTVAYLKEIGRKILTRTYHYQAIQHLLLFAEEDLLNHRCVENMAKLFTVEEALDSMKLLIQTNKVMLDSTFQEVILKVLKLIEYCGSKSETQKKKNASMTRMPLILEDEVQKLEYKFDAPTYETMYVLDVNPEKYEVCFHCLKKTNKELLCCPCCGTVKFCSEVCNKFNNKTHSKHPCNILFYDSTKKTLDEYKSTGKLPLTGIDLLMSEAREIREEEKRIEALKKQAEEEEKMKSASKRGIRKQKNESQQSLRNKSRSLQNGAASISFIREGSKQEDVAKRKLSVCCRKVSSIFICDETTSFQTRRLNCGFHCGQNIPDVQLDNQGNIVLEQEFCVCYPLYKEGSEFKSKTTDEKQQLQVGKDLIKDHLKDEIKKGEGDELSRDYNLNEIFGGVFDMEEMKRREAEELDKFIRSFAKSEGYETIDKEKDNEPLNQDIVSISYEKHEGKGEQLIEKEGIAFAKRINNKDQSEASLKMHGKHKMKETDYDLIKRAKEFKDKMRKEKGGEEEKLNREMKTKDKKGKVKKKLQSYVEDATLTKGESSRKGKYKKVDENESDATLSKEEKGKPKRNLREKIDRGGFEFEKRKKKEQRGLKTENSEEIDKEKKKKKQTGSKTKSSEGIDKKKMKERTQKDSKTNSSGGIEKENKKKNKDKSAGGSIKHDKKTMTKKEGGEKKKKKIEKETQADGKLKSREILSTRTGSQKDKGKRDKSREKRRRSEKQNKMKKEKAEKAEQIEKQKKREVISRRKKKILEEKKLRNGEKVKDKKSAIRKGEGSDKGMKGYSSRKDEISKIAKDKGRQIPMARALASMRALKSTLLNPEALLDLSSDNFEEFKRVSRVYQYFLELLSEYFPDFDLSCLLLPFACFMDGQLYYKFSEPFPFYCRTYSTT